MYTTIKTKEEEEEEEVEEEEENFEEEEFEQKVDISRVKPDPTTVSVATMENNKISIASKKVVSNSSTVEIMPNGKKKIVLVVDEIDENHLNHFLTVLPHLRRINEGSILRYNNVVNLITQRFTTKESEWDDDSSIFNLLPKRAKRRRRDDFVKKDADDGEIILLF